MRRVWQQLKGDHNQDRISIKEGETQSSKRTKNSHILSSSISSSTSTSSPRSRPSNLIVSLASLGKLKLVLRLEVPLPGRPVEGARPVLENDVLREEGPESPPLAVIGEGGGRDEGGLAVWPLRSKLGMSVLQKIQWKWVSYVPPGRDWWGLERTAFESICFCVVPHIGSLWLCDLHLTILLSLCQCQILLVPL